MPPWDKRGKSMQVPSTYKTLAPSDPRLDPRPKGKRVMISEAMKFRLLKSGIQSPPH